MTYILTTDGGPHPADKWAVATAEQIVETDPSMPADRRLAAEKLKLAVAEAVLPHHAKNIEAERARISLNPTAILSPPVIEFIEEAVKAVVDVAASTQWASHFASPTVQAIIGDIITRHFGTAQFIERSWHADQHPDTDVSKQFKGNI